MSQHVKSRIENGLGIVEFFTEKSNSLPSSVLNELAAKIAEFSKDESVQIILLRSEGDKAFCAGASFEELSNIQTKEQGLNFFSGFAKVILAIKNSKKIVIGRIQGKAVGGGVGLASACDYAVATKYASVRLSELAVGIGPFVIGPAVERKIGLSAFSMMALNATEWQTAIWAKEKGLYHEVFETTEQMDAWINHFCNILLQSSPEALCALKSIFWEGTDHWAELLISRATISGELVLSDFAKTAISNFL